MTRQSRRGGGLRRRRWQGAVAAGVGVVAVTGGLLGSTAVAAPRVPKAAAPQVNSATVLMHLTSSKMGISTGKVRSGPVLFRATASDDESFQVVAFKPGGYTSTRQFAADLAKVENAKANLAALHRIDTEVTAIGGADVAPGATRDVMVRLNHPGTYYVYRDADSGATNFQTITVYGTTQLRPVHPATAAIYAVDDERFAVASVLPRKGQLLFGNESVEDNHFIVLIQLKPGTTRQQIIDYAASDSDGPPPFAIGAFDSSDVVSPGHTQVMSYDLPAGSYGVLCFYPDDMTGKPHAAMGMVALTTLK